jgi:hypothetical protein
MELLICPSFSQKGIEMKKDKAELSSSSAHTKLMPCGYKPMNTIRHFLFLGIVPSFIFLILAVLTLSWVQNIHLSNALQSDLNSTYHLFYGELYKEATMVNLLVDQLAENSEVRDAFLNQERERLLKTARPFFQNFRADYDITHCYFHTMDKEVFLRVHYPDLHGDVIDRFTLNEAEQTGSVSYGLELGTLGTLTLRVVMPWRVNDQIVGYLEIGKEIDNILVEMKKILEVDFVLIINKKHLDKENWGQGGYGLIDEVSDWDQFPDVVVFGTTRETLPPIIDVDLSRSHHYRDNPMLEFNENGHQYLAGFAPLLDAANMDIGDIILIKDFSKMKTVAKRITLLVLTGYFFTVLLYIGFVFYYLRRTRANGLTS